MKTKLVIFILATFIFTYFHFSINSFAQDGSLDLGFGLNGTVTTAIGSGNDEAISLAIQSDGKIVVAGNSTNGSNNDFAIARYNSNGTLDAGFGTTGTITTDFGSNYDNCQSVAIQTDGKIVAAGSSHNGTNWDFALVRYNSDGTLDLSFGTDGKLTTDFASNNDVGTSLALQSDGKIVVTGYSQDGIYGYDFAVARYNDDGSPDLSFGTEGKVITPVMENNDTPRSIAIQNDGKIVVAGYCIIDEDMYFGVVRYNIDGSLDISFSDDGKITTTFGNNGDYGLSVAVQTDEKIVVSGFTYNLIDGLNRDIAVARYNSDGSLDLSFSEDGKLTTAFELNHEEGFSVAIQNDGKILVAGYSKDDIKSNFAVVRYNPDGTPDLNFGTNGKLTTAIGSGNDEGRSIALQNDGKIVVAGFSFNGTNKDFALVRYNNSTINGIQNLSGKDLIIDLYPNPASEVVVVKVNEHFIGSNYTISNSLGKIVKTGILTSVVTVININDLPGGMYLILVKEQKQHMLKLIK